MGLSKKLIDELKDTGADKYVIAYHSANTETDYESMLIDQTTPTHILTFITERITKMSYKLLCLKHKNIDNKSIFWLFQTNTFSLKKFIFEVFQRKDFSINFLEEVASKLWLRNKFDDITLELLKEQANIPSKTVECLCRNIPFIMNNEKYMNIKSAIIAHKNVNVNTIKRIFKIAPDTFIDDILMSPAYTIKVGMALYKQTGNSDIIPSDVKDVFLF